MTRVILACSPGGHATELAFALSETETSEWSTTVITFGERREDWGISAFESRWVSLTHPRRGFVRMLINIAQSAWSVCRARPQLVISTGADVAVATFVLSKLLFRARALFIESAGQLTHTRSGKLCYPFADCFIVQWPEQLHSYPKATLARHPMV